MDTKTVITVELSGPNNKNLAETLALYLIDMFKSSELYFKTKPAILEKYNGFTEDPIPVHMPCTENQFTISLKSES